MTDQGELARRLKAAREAIGLTAAAAAKEAGVADAVLAQVEAGDAAPNSVELVKLAWLYGRGPGEFFAPTFSEESPAAASLRAACATTDRVERDALRDRLVLARELAALEDLTGIERSASPGAWLPAVTGEASEKAETTVEDLRARLLTRALEAYRLQLITRRKLVSLAEAAGGTEEEWSAVRAAIDEAEEAVPAELPAALLEIAANRRE